MITRHHVTLVILCTTILCSALVPFDPVLILVICLGGCTGAILPDIQMGVNYFNKMNDKNLYQAVVRLVISSGCPIHGNSQ